MAMLHLRVARNKKRRKFTQFSPTIQKGPPSLPCGKVRTIFILRRAKK
jgi:hypothetical protein